MTTKNTNEAAVVADLDLPALPSEDECWVHIYPCDLKRMERTETHKTVFSVAVGNAEEKSVPLYTADQVREAQRAAVVAALARSAAPAPSLPDVAMPEGFALVPLYPNAEMIRAMADDEWAWEDLLAAAGAITEDQYSEIYGNTGAASLPDMEMPEQLTPLDYRAQGREEVLSIILGQSAEDPFAECIEWSKSAPPEDEGGSYWDEDKLRALLHIGDKKHAAYDRAEAAYWDAMGHKDEAARELLFAQQAPFYQPLHDFLAKHEAWDLMGDLKRAAQPAEGSAQVATHEARRWCKGDAEWTNWAPISEELRATYEADETFEVRPIAAPERSDTPAHLAEGLKRIKGHLMHARRFGPDTLRAFQQACGNAECEIEELLARKQGAQGDA